MFILSSSPNYEFIENRNYAAHTAILLIAKRNKNDFILTPIYTSIRKKSNFK